jgi:hypothetical protein
MQKQPTIPTPTGARSQKRPVMANLEEINFTVHAQFDEFAEDIENGTLMTFTNFCHFLVHAQLFTSAFTHFDALDIYQDAAGQSQDVDEPLLLDESSFRVAVEKIAAKLHGEGASGSPTGNRTQSANLMQVLIHDIHLMRSTSPFDAQAAALVRGPICIPEVVCAIYQYHDAITQMFCHYATNNVGELAGQVPLEELRKPGTKAAASVSCKSAFHLCCALGLVPD